VSGSVKSLAVRPLAWMMLPTATEGPVVAKVATRSLTSLSQGTVRAMV